MAPAAADHDDDTRLLLVGRLRTGLWLILVGIVTFALSDPVMHPDLFRRLYEIEQVILNLVRNGFEATASRVAQESDPREVVIRTARTPQGAEITVSDTGPGVAAEAAARLFEPFFTTKRDGLGLGLSISRSIVEAHGGRLWTSPNAPRGATFHVELPPPPGARGVAA
jgi:two-component system, LuxR family, sensor kinase FixL